MTIKDYKALHVAPLSPRTDIFLLKNDQILLGYKKTGFGKGNYVGIGGKVEEGETIEEAARREVFEEIGVHVSKFIPKGTIAFYFPDPTWNLIIHAFTATEWEGEPEETNEIRPVWFPTNKLPFEAMWDDAKYWIPRVIKGEVVRDEYLYDEKMHVIDSALALVEKSL